MIKSMPLVKEYGEWQVTYGVQHLNANMCDTCLELLKWFVFTQFMHNLSALTFARTLGNSEWDLRLYTLGNVHLPTQNICSSEALSYFKIPFSCNISNCKCIIRRLFHVANEYYNSHPHIANIIILTFIRKPSNLLRSSWKIYRWNYRS